MFKSIAKGLIVASFLALPVLAESVPNNNKTAVQEDRVSIAKKLVDDLGLKDSYQETIKELTDGLIRRYPNLSSAKDKILNFYNKYIGWDAIKDDVAKIYAKHFTTQELKDLIKFYESPTGKKTLKELPAIMMEGRELGMKKVSAHLNELKAIIEEAAKAQTQNKK